MRQGTVLWLVNLLGCLALQLIVCGLRNPLQLVAIGRSTGDVDQLSVDPIEGCGLILSSIAHRRLRFVRTRAIQRKALAGRTLVHEERRGAGRAWQQPAADELECERL